MSLMVAIVALAELLASKTRANMLLQEVEINSKKIHFESARYKAPSLKS